MRVIKKIYEDSITKFVQRKHYSLGLLIWYDVSAVMYGHEQRPCPLMKIMHQFVSIINEQTVI